MSETDGKGIPIEVIEKVTPKIYGSTLLKKAVDLAQMDGNIVDKQSKEDLLNALLGEELHGSKPDDKADLSLYGKIFNNPDEQDRKRRVDKYKQELLYPIVLTDPKIAATKYLEEEYKIAWVRGQGADVSKPEEATSEIRRQASEIVINDQKKSLDTWVNYLTSSHTQYPTWFKYYVLASVTKMGVYDKEKQEFSKRTDDTITKFPDLNREALSYAYDTLFNYYVKGEKHNNEELQKILETANFSKIYAFAIEKATLASKENKEKTEGEWTKFNQGDDHIPLYESLQGHGTGWCTAGEETARTQLKGGDFYVYYSKDEKGNNTIPRIAIRMENEKVAEVRGIDPDQNLETKMLDIAKEKYHQLPGGEKFDKKDHDMKLLTLVDEKVQKNQELTIDELKFIYEIDSKIEGFGYEKDPRIKEIIEKTIILPNYWNIVYDIANDHMIPNLIEATQYKGDKIKNKVWNLVENKGGEETAQFLSMSMWLNYDNRGIPTANNDVFNFIINNSNDKSIANLLERYNNLTSKEKDVLLKSVAEKGGEKTGTRLINGLSGMVSSDFKVSEEEENKLVDLLTHIPGNDDLLKMRYRYGMRSLSETNRQKISEYIKSKG